MDVILNIIRRESSSTVDRLFGVASGSQWVCKSIFEGLSPLSQIILTRLVYCTTSVHTRDIDEWLLSGSCRSLVAELEDLHIVRLDDQLVIPNTNFVQSLRHCLLSQEEPWEGGLLLSASALGNKSSSDFLYAHSSHEWEKILYFLATGDAEVTVSDTVRNFMLECELMNYNDARQLIITEKGYEFMLKDFNTQVCKLNC